MAEMIFSGAARRTTGSLHLFRHQGKTLCLECGLFQGRREEARQLNLHLPPEARDIDAVVVSHAHIDHTGRLPLLVKAGYRGPIYCTPATLDLCRIMLPDSAHIQEEDADFWNRKRAQNGDRIEPLYTAQDARAVEPLLRPMECGTPREVLPGVTVTLLEAGHILGSTMVLLEYRQNAQPRRLLFSGDVGRFDQPILRDPVEPPPQADYLLTECTYADRRHDDIAGMQERLCRIIQQTVQAGGKVIIPAFSVGRTQSVVYFLEQLFRQGRLKPLPVYVDSPLSAQATEVFARHPECYDAQATDFWRSQGELLSDGRFIHYITDVADSKALNGRPESCVILSASGMCESGRILHHLKNNIEDERNTVVVVGFMAQHTLGRRIVERREELKIYGRAYRLLAKVEVLNGFSAHADAAEFRRLYAPIAPKLRGAFVVHGEDRQPIAMQELLDSLGCHKSQTPQAGQHVTLD